IGAALSLPVFLLAMGTHVVGNILPPDVRLWVELLLTTPVVFWCGWPILRLGVSSIRSMNPNMFTLILIGTGVAYLYSVIVVLAPGLFPGSFKGEHGQIGVYFEAAA